jgi:hypothetical protein
MQILAHADVQKVREGLATDQSSNFSTSRDPVIAMNRTSHFFRLAVTERSAIVRFFLQWISAIFGIMSEWRRHIGAKPQAVGKPLEIPIACGLATTADTVPQSHLVRKPMIIRTPLRTESPGR